MENKKKKTVSGVRVMFDQMLVWRRWVEVYQKGYHITDYLHKRGVQKVAIYGMADIGIALYNELVNSDIEVLYALDKAKEKSVCDVEVRKPEEIDNKIDIVIVTAVSYFSDIYDYIKEITSGQIKLIGIDEILASLLVEEV